MSLINRAVYIVLLFLDRSGGILALLTNRNLFIHKVHIGHGVNYSCLATKQWEGNQSAFLFFLWKRGLLIHPYFGNYFGSNFGSDTTRLKTIRDRFRPFSLPNYIKKLFLWVWKVVLVDSTSAQSLAGPWFLAQLRLHLIELNERNFRK